MAKCGSNWVKKDGHSRGLRQCKRNKRCRKHQEGAKHRFTSEQKERSVKMRAEGMILSATARVMGSSVPTVSKRVKKGDYLATERLTRFLAWRTSGRPGGVRWRIFGARGRDESAFSRLLDRLPRADRYEADAYPVYEWLPGDRHVIGKGGAVNRNEGLHSKLRSKLNRLVRRIKGYTKSVNTLKHLLAIALEERLNQSLKIH